MGWRDYQLPANQKNTLLQTPLTEIKKPLCIQSGYLNDTFYLVANEAQAQEIEAGGGVAYTTEEIRTLLAKGLAEEELRKIHMIKRTFEGSRVR